MKCYIDIVYPSIKGQIRNEFALEFASFRADYEQSWEVTPQSTLIVQIGSEALRVHSESDVIVNLFLWFDFLNMQNAGYSLYVYYLFSARLRFRFENVSMFRFYAKFVVYRGIAIVQLYGLC